MKILEVSFMNSFKPNSGGVESYINKLTNYLLDNNHSITIICSSTANKTMKSDQIIELYTGKIMRKLIYNIKLYFYVKKHRKDFDVIHINGDNGYFIPFIKNIKTVMTLHGSRIESGMMGIKNFKLKLSMNYITNILGGYMEIFACKRSNRVIAVSNHIKEYFSKKCERNDIEVIPTCICIKNVINISDIEKKKLDRFRENYDIICVWAGIDPVRKGLEIAKNSVKKFNNVILYTVGYKDKENAENVINLGYIDKNLLLYLYQISDIFIFPSKYEGFSSALLEAMSYGLIPLCFSIPSTEELINESVNGFLLNTNADFESKIQYFIDNKSKIKIMKESAMKRSEDFKCTLLLPRIERIFIELLK